MFILPFILEIFRELYMNEFLQSEIIENLLHLLEYKDLETTQYVKLEFSLFSNDISHLLRLSFHLLATFFSYPGIHQYIPRIPDDYLYTFTK